MFGEAYIAEMIHFAAFVRGEAEADNTLADARAALVLALAASHSVAMRRPVQISEVFE